MSGDRLCIAKERLLCLTKKSISSEKAVSLANLKNRTLAHAKINEFPNRILRILCAVSFSAFTASSVQKILGLALIETPHV
jgi:hypothetical protein